MKAVLLLAALLLAGCATRPAELPIGAPFLIDHDRGDLIGTWQAADGLTFATMVADHQGGMTFSAARGCDIVQGVLRPLGTARYRVEAYAGQGWSIEGCPTPRAGPGAAPFTATEVRLERRGRQLLASGGGAERILQRDRLPDLTVRGEHLQGEWRLLASRPEHPEREARTRLIFDRDRFVFASACNRQEGNLTTLPGLVIVMGGSERIGQMGDCDVRTVGDLLVERFAQNSLRLSYRPSDDRIVARLGARSFEFVRG